VSKPPSRKVSSKAINEKKSSGGVVVVVVVVVVHIVAPSLPRLSPTPEALSGTGWRRASHPTME